MLQRIRRMLIKEFLQMLRDPRMRVVVFGVPVIQMTVMAFALTTDVTNIRTAVYDMDRSPASRQLLSDFTASGYFRIEAFFDSEKEIAVYLDRADVRVVISIPAGFANDLATGRTARVQFITDGTDSNSTAIALGYASVIVNNYSNTLMIRRNQANGLHFPAIQVKTVTRAWFNSNEESKYYYVPSLIATMLFIFSLLLPSIGIVREKEIGTIEQVMVTPIRRLEFIIGKTLPYMITGYISMTIMLIVAFVIFQVQVHGSLLLLYLLTGIYLCGNMGIALLISASAVTQQQALLTSFLILMPSVMLSGFMFPIKNMPEIVQYLTWVNPMRWYLEILRGIVLKSINMHDLWPAVAAQSTLTIIFISAAANRFKKTLS
jgi:ABC-2 type transport system permease protein